jgi:uncharacterized repeat protein (TIGR02543 family)
MRAMRLFRIAALAITAAAVIIGCPGLEVTATSDTSDDTRWIKYLANGGQGTPPPTQTFKKGTVITIADKGGLTYEGKYFSGWHTSISGNDKFGTAYAPGDSLTMNYHYTLYAQWADQTYTVTYYANGASGYIPPPRTVSVGTDITVTNPAYGPLTYAEKTFSGWNTQADGSGTSYAIGDSLKVTADIDLYAQWTPIPYTITYNDRGSGTVPDPQTVDAGESVTLPDGSELSNGNIPFAGWNTSADGTGTHYEAGSSYRPTDNVTLYAVWVTPRIRTGDSYKRVTDGTVRITLMTDAQSIPAGTESYYLYRSTSKNTGYTKIAEITASAQPVLEDPTVNWTAVGFYYYKVAAVVGTTEIMSANGVELTIIAGPKLYMRTAAGQGYCGVRLINESASGLEWIRPFGSSAATYELVPPTVGSPYLSPGDFTLYIATSSSSVFNLWDDKGLMTMKRCHSYTINFPFTSIPSGSFDTSNWDFFTPQ